jgi:sugar lactone lactonase YvrE
MEPFLLTASASEIQSNPRCIARTSNGHFFVTMHTRGSVIQLDARGKFVNEIFAPGTKIAALAKPEGLAADEKDRLWIVESGTNNIVIYDPQTDGLSARVPGKTQQSFLSNPVGIIPGPDKSMLVADRKNNRIVAVWENGTAKAFCGHSGSGPGELLQPLGLCIASRNQEDGFWVVDERNHRLQKFDFSARYIQRIGKCGPGKGSFLMPQFVAQFPDGILVVSQNQADCNLKVFSPDGIELDCMFLDYVPAGLLVSDRMLFVAEWSGQSIRVYERIGDSTAELKNSSKP